MVKNEKKKYVKASHVVELVTDKDREKEIKTEVREHLKRQKK